MRCGSNTTGSPQDDSNVESWTFCSSKQRLKGWGPRRRLQEIPNPNLEVLQVGSVHFEAQTSSSVTSKALWPCTRLARHLGLPWLLDAPVKQINQAIAIEEGICTGGLLPVRKRRLLRDIIDGNEQPLKVSCPQCLPSVLSQLQPPPSLSLSLPCPASSLHPRL